MSRIVSEDMTARWLNQFKIGDQRPVCRAIVQRQNVKKFEYDTAWTQGGQYETSQHRTGWFTSMVFGDDSPYREIPNVQSVSWERSIGQDAATCTLALLNTAAAAVGEASDSPEDFDRPGYFTYNRGQVSEAENRWGYDSETGWNGIFVPDMVVKTFEGYGVDYNVTPFLDPNLMQSGVWLIDDVEYRSDGVIILTMRDLARLLIADNIAFPPIVPRGEYPLRWIKTHSENVASRDAVGGAWSGKLQGMGTATSSNELYLDEDGEVVDGLTNEPFDRYVGPNGGVEGHHASHALYGDNDNDLYWRSTGQDDNNDFVWWQFEPNSPMPVGALRLKASGGPYRVFISIDDGGGWVGERKIGYHLNGITGSPGNVNIEANIPFIKGIIVDRFYALDTNLPEALNATRIRLTFTRLHESDVGEHPWRAGLRQLQLYTADSLGDLGYEPGEKLKVIGNYSDYTHIVKWCCAWAGWYWPPEETGLDFIRVQDGDGDSKNFITFNTADPALPKGRVWGDFMKTGTAGEADLTADHFDKRPLMDCINYVRDIVAYNFFIDETGGVVWRMPNLGLPPDIPHRLGNYLSPTSVLDPGPAFGSPQFRGRYGRTAEIVELDERENLFAYTTKLSSQSIRERIFVGDAVGGIGTVIKGFNPYPIGLRRIAGWTDQHFDTKQETKVMADMISARSMFAYRRSQSTIPGYPKIQIDDMVRIYERMTNETFYHYVLGIKSEMDMAEGVWTYTLDTHWLGEEPEDSWIVDVTELSGATQAYLEAVGYEPEDAEDNGSENPSLDLP